MVPRAKFVGNHIICMLCHDFDATVLRRVWLPLAAYVIVNACVAPSLSLFGVAPSPCFSPLQ